jgi:hypothetical protein
MTEPTDIPRSTDANDASGTVFPVFELYHNPHEYSSYEASFPLLVAVSPTLEDAAEMLARKKIDELQTIVDSHKPGQEPPPLRSNMFVSKISVNQPINPLNSTRIPVTESHLTLDTKNKLHSVVSAYNQFSKPASESSRLTTRNALRVEHSTYEKDRRAREWEMIHRMNFRPLWTQQQSVQNASTPASTIPQPASQVNIRPAHPINAQTTTAVRPTTHFAGSTTPSLSAPPAVPGVLPSATQTPNPVNTSVPLAPTVSGGRTMDNYNNNLVPDSTGYLHPVPPANTATSPNSRVTQ